MGTTMNRATYEKIIAEDLVWLLEQPHSLERMHIEQVLRDSPLRLYQMDHTHSCKCGTETKQDGGTAE